MSRPLQALALTCSLFLLGCGDSGQDPSDGAVGADGQVGQDAGVGIDAGDTEDAGQPPDGPHLGPCAILPADNFWNTDISDLPVHALSDAYIASIGTNTGLHPDFGTEWNGAPNGIPYVLVPGDQALVPVSFYYPDESDPGPYPIPADAPIEGGPQGDGDRHILVVETGSCTLYEMYDAWPDGAGWASGSGAVWHLNANERRPDGWTSADAAGLPILPGLVRYDEAVEQGEIRHALRFTVSSAQSAYLYPATHSDGQGGSDPNNPPMGQRLRLRADFDLQSFSLPIQAILQAMKTYGLVVADTGSDWFISGAPDPRWDDDMLRELGDVVGSDFEAVDNGEAIHVY